ncbi:MAG: hypothetical protein JRN09_02770 [Nitrososphaerota archaeon]|jgi:hypothetical protein|nr:hypothetical protein [Nitrososphaerota archaeon]
MDDDIRAGDDAATPTEGKVANLAVIVPALVGAVLIAWSSWVAVLGRPDSNELGWAYVLQGYVVSGMASEVLAATMLAFRYRTGRIAVAGASVTLLNLAFLWTSRGPWDTTLVNRVVDPIALGLVGVGVDTGIGIAVVDVVFLAALLAAGTSTFLLSGRVGWSSFLNSLLVTSSLTLLLALEVYAWDRGEFYVHFTSLSPPWFTNYVLAVSSLSVLCVATVLRVGLGPGRRRPGA